MQKACVQMNRKGKHTQPLKNAQINQNDQTQIDETGRFYGQNNQPLTWAKKKDKKFDNPPKTSCCCQKDVFKNAEAQQEAKYDNQ